MQHYDTGLGGGDGPTQARSDKRVNDLQTNAQSKNLLNSAATTNLFDPFGGISREVFNHDKRPQLYTGFVVYALPYCNWYRVQLDGLGGTIGCTLGDASHFIPIGPRSTTTLPPGATVVVWRPPGLSHGVILSAFPMQVFDQRLIVPDWVVQGSQSGIKREDVYSNIIRTHTLGGGVQDFNVSRPMDSTILEWGKICETGVGFHLDPFMAFMRVSEMCGLWVNYWDQHLRLASVNLDIQNTSFEITARSDEGEAQYFEGHNTYVWEGMGMYAPDQKLATDYDPVDVQYKIAKGAVDLAEGMEDVQAINRYQEFGGYLGQGRKRMVMVPGDTTGIRHYADDPRKTPDMGVFEESIALDGGYYLRSAKEVMLLKHCLIPVPKQIRLPEDQQSGDDARKDNYKFAGTFGNGSEHNVGDIDTSQVGENRHLLTSAGVAELIAYNFNWKGLHPFHYHTQDYVVPDESDLKNSKRGGLQRAQDFLSFAELASSHSMSAPQAKKVTVDDRYGEVDYFQRTAGIALLPDGGITIFDGYGSEITLAGGHVRISCPGDVQLTPGRNLVAMGGDDIVLRAKRSADLTAGSGDVRIKAENNLQLLGGNSGIGGVLVESKAAGFLADFENKVGEDVVSGGIILKAPRSAVVNWCGTYYVRTGSEGSDEGKLNQGSIVFDASKGEQRIVMKGQYIESFAASGVLDYIGVNNENDDVKTVYAYGQNAALMGGDLVVNGDYFGLGNLICTGFGASGTGFGAVSGNRYVGKIEGREISKATNEARQDVQQQLQAGKQQHNALFTKGLYVSGSAGNDRTIDKAMFSLRDDDSQAQYNTQGFVVTESRWQQMARLGGGTPGTLWREPTVSYQGTKQLPYPGYKKWTEDKTLLRLKSLKLYDAAAGISQNRGTAYEDPSFDESETVTPVAGFTTIK